MGFLDEHKFTKISQIGSPLSITFEVCDHEEESVGPMDPRRDIFWFGLVMFDIIAAMKVAGCR
jgi:hypothetical protein